MGLCYDNGIGVVKDNKKHLNGIKKAAEQGELAAQYHLGECCDKGNGVEKSARIALDWYKKPQNREMHKHSIL